MDHIHFMLRAINLAKKSDEAIPCGVVLVHEGKIVAEAYNTQHNDHDVTAHAEMKALRIAGKAFQRKNLENMVAYVTCEPCSMCSSALIYARVTTIYYGMPIANIDHDNKRIKITIEELAAKSPRPVTISRKFLYQECSELYHDRLIKMALLNANNT